MDGILWLFYECPIYVGYLHQTCVPLYLVTSYMLHSYALDWQIFSCTPTYICMCLCTYILYRIAGKFGDLASSLKLAKFNSSPNAKIRHFAKYIARQSFPLYSIQAFMPVFTYLQGTYICIYVSFLGMSVPRYEKN